MNHISVLGRPGLFRNFCVSGSISLNSLDSKTLGNRGKTTPEDPPNLTRSPDLSTLYASSAFSAKSGSSRI